MRSIEILRYLKRWMWLVVACMVMGILFVYMYATKNQSYSASVVIHYNNPEASLYGYAPDGKPIDFSEIYSASVISDAIEALGLTESVESIRKNCSVQEVIPADVQALQKSALEKGEEYTYYPTSCMVTFRSTNAAGTSYVLRVLDAILDAYFRQYAEKHISKVAVPNNSANVTTEAYDYLECTDIISGSVEELVQYCSDKTAQAPKFRSSATGYSFQDLLSVYQYYSDNLIPELYASVLNNRMTKSVDVLMERYNNDIAFSHISIANLSDQIEKLKALLDDYVDKEKEGIEYHFGTTASGSYILDSVYDDDYETMRREYTVYDKMIFRYADLSQQVEVQKINIEHDEKILGYFQSGSYQENAETHKTEAMINQLPVVLGELYQLLCDTVDEYNDYSSAQSISNLTNISTSAAINVKLYVAIAVVLFGVIGTLGAVFLGRLGDLIEYLVYVDKNVGIYNRARCDLMINEMSKKLVNDQFACLVLRITNLRELNRTYGREKGDLALKTAASCLKQAANRYDSFAGYNEGAMFIGLFKEKSNSMMVELLDEISHSFFHSMELLESGDVARDVAFSVGIANSTEDSCYQVRKLLQIAVTRSSQATAEQEHART